MKSLSTFCLIVLVALTSNNMMRFCFAESKLQLPFVRYKVIILNEMTASTLTVHCKSKDDDLGEHVLHTGDNYNWSFRENFWISTLFWCHFSSKHGQVSGNVFWTAKWNWLNFQCVHHTCTWVCRDHSIYLYFGSRSAFELMYQWK